MNSKVNNLIDEIESMDKKDKMEFIYKWHNGLRLAEQLQASEMYVGFEFKPVAGSDEYLFENEIDQRIVLNEHGDVVESEIEVPSIFILISQQRLAKTKCMLDLLGYSN